MSVWVKALFCTTLLLLVSELIVEAMTPVKSLYVKQPESSVNRATAFAYLRDVGHPNERNDICVTLDPDQPNETALEQANYACRYALNGFNMLVSNNEVPNGWVNPCDLAYSPKCRKLNSSGPYRCTVKLPYKAPVGCCISSSPRYQSLRRCSRGLHVPQN